MLNPTDDPQVTTELTTYEILPDNTMTTFSAGLADDDFAPLTDVEGVMITKLTQRLLNVQRPNAEKFAYLEGTIPVEQLNISNHPNLRNMRLACTFPGIVVNTISERINLEGFNADSEELLDDIRDIFAANYLRSEFSAGVKDSLTIGCSYVSLGYGDTSAFEPKILWIHEDPNTVIGDYSPRTRRLSSFLKVTFDENGMLEHGALETPGEQVFFEYIHQGISLVKGQHQQSVGYRVIQRVTTGVPFVRAVFMPNNLTSQTPTGSSEITRNVRFATQSALRKYSNSEVAAEIYAHPLRVLTNINPESLTDADGNVDPSRINSLITGTMVLPPNAEGTGNPGITQLPAGDPNTLIKLIDNLRKEIALETGIPEGAMGVAQASAPSADSLKMQEVRLVKKCNDKIDRFSQAAEQAMRIAMLMLHPELSMKDLNSITAEFGDAASPTRAADTDSVMKLVSVGVLRPDSEVTYSLLNLSEPQKRILRAELKTAQGARLTEQLEILAAEAMLTPGVAELTNRDRSLSFPEDTDD